MAKIKLLSMDPEFEKDEDQQAKAGRPPFEPTEEQRELVTKMAQAGIRLGEMCLMIRWPNTDKPISIRTLQRCFERELTDAPILLNVQAAASLFAMVKAGNLGATIFWLKCRAGWREIDGQATDPNASEQQGPSSGVLVVPGVVDPKDWEAIVSASQGELMERARKYIESGVVDAEDAVMRPTEEGS